MNEPIEMRYIPRRSHTLALVAQYIDEQLSEGASIAKPSPAPAETFVQLCVGKLRFLLPSEAITTAIPSPEAVLIDAQTLVPEKYRVHARSADDNGPPVVLQGGRLALSGVTSTTVLSSAEVELKPRAERASEPWISGTSRRPPAFVLDVDALKFHFLRAQQ